MNHSSKNPPPHPKNGSATPSNPEVAATANFIDPFTRRHLLDALYEIFAKPQLKNVHQSENPSIYIRHQEGQRITGAYKIEKIFEETVSGLYAEGRIPLAGIHPPVLVIRGYGSWYPFDRVLEDTPDVFIAALENQLKAAETQGVIEWLKYHTHHGNPPDVIGESLGGKVAQQIAAKYPHYLRSTVTFNALGVAPKLAAAATTPHVFHYFTLGERYAFWANGGDYIPGTIFQISPRGKNCQYKITEKMITQAKFPKDVAAFKAPIKKRHLFFLILAQFILLHRHNSIILNQPKPVVVEINSDQLHSF